jgi:hypothetical protein
MSNLSFSFDTVCVLIPINDPDPQTKFVSSKAFYGSNPDGTPSYEWSKQYFWPADKLALLPSSWSPPQISFEGNNLILQFSLPKLLNGHSAKMETHLLTVLEAWEKVLSLDFAMSPAVSFLDWRLRRVDLCYNFKLDTPEMCKGAIDQLSRLRHRGNLAHSVRRKRLAYWPSSTCTVKFYCKGEEMKHNKQDYSEDWLQARQYGLDCILRYEEEWKKQKLTRFCGVNSMMDVTVRRFSQALAKWSVEEHLQKINKQFTVRGVPVSVEDLIKKIRTKRKPGPLLDFISKVLDQGIEPVRQEYPDRTFYNHCAALRQLGFDVSMLEAKYDSPFGQIVDLSTWVSADRFCTDFDFEKIGDDPLFTLVTNQYESLMESGNDTYYKAI